MAQSNGRAVLVTSAFNPVGPENDDPSARGEFDLRNFEKLPVHEAPVNALSPGVSLRREGTDAAHIELLVDAANSAELPPILVQLDGYRVIDGLHRLEAARLRGEDSIRARFLDCSNSEALVIAMKANGSHGLPLAKADRVSGALRVLDSHPDWSDRAIAGITGLSAKTIASLRRRSTDGAPCDGKRIGRDGRRRPVDAGEGRRRAAEYIAAHPNAPLRQVAKATDVSLGTVHDVRARLLRGDSPERNGRRTPAPTGPQPVRPAQPLRTERSGRIVRPVRDAGEETGPVVVLMPGDTDRAPLRVAPMGEPPAPPRRNHTDVPPAWATVAAKMAGDPAIRYTAGGREFLRWMQLHATDPGEEWRELIDAVPPHWLGVIAPIAERIGKEWGMLAERLRTRQETAP